MYLSMRDIGQACKQYRTSKGYRQIDVGDATGYTAMNVSAFETGRNDNAKLLLWYFANGMTYEDILTYVRGV